MRLLWLCYNSMVFSRPITMAPKSSLFWAEESQTYLTQACNTCPTGLYLLEIYPQTLRQLHPRFAAYITQILLQPLVHSPALIGRYMGSTVVISSCQSAPWDSRLQSYSHLTTTRMAAPSLQSYPPALALFLAGVVRYWTMSKQAESLLNYPATLFIPSILIAPSQQANSSNFRQQLSHSSGSPALFLLLPLLSTLTTIAERYLTNLSQGSNRTGGLCPIKPSHSPIFGDSVADNCRLIVAVHSHTEEKCLPQVIITPPPIPPN
jgi:hypothetical protein